MNCIFQTLMMLLIVCSLAGCGAKEFKDPLTPMEREWLMQHGGKITLAVETGYAPFAFVDENGESRGLATEYIELLESKLNFKMNKVPFHSLNEILNAAEKKEIDIVNAVTRTQNRSKYLLFTKPFIEIPNVIIVRKDQKRNLSIDQMKNMKISLVKDYAITEYLTGKYNDLEIEPALDDLTALLSVSFNRTDAAIIDLATASYFIGQKGITNLRIAGDTGHNIKLAIASRNDWPVFNQILEKGLSLISDREQKVIKDKWISSGQVSLADNRSFWIIIVTAFSVFLLAIGIIMVWNRVLKRQVELHTRRLKKELTERTIAEKERNKLEAQLSAAMEISSLGHWEYDVATDRFTFNDQFFRIFRTTAAETGGYTMSSDEYSRRFLYPEDRHMVEEENLKAFETTDPNFSRKLEHRFFYPDGTVGYISVRYFIVKDKEGKTIKTYGVNQDITEQKKAEIALRESEEKFSKAFHNSPVVMSITTVNEGEFLDVNTPFLKLMGLTRKEVIGKKAADVGVWKNIDRKDILAELNQFGFVHGKEIEVVAQSGKTIPLLWFGDIVQIRNTPCVIASGFDLTEQKMAENEIKKQKRLFETMFNTIPDGVVITNTQREILLANKGMESTFGYKPEDLLGRSTQMLYAAQSRYSEAGTIVFNSNAKRSGELYVTRYRDKNGREFSGETFGAKLVDENNNWIGNLGIMRDITEREQSEIRIQQIQKMESIGNLAGGIAHDFNNILFPIVGMSELLLEDLRPGTLEYENVQEILKAGKRGSDLVKQILAFSRQTEHKMIPVRIQQILKEVIRLSRSTIPADIVISQDIQTDCGLILADPTQVHQIAMNLITNAYHAVESTGGSIHVQLKEIRCPEDGFSRSSLKSGRYALLAVSDTGCGIRPEVMDRIFDPYFTTKEQGKGTGLGLSVVHGIVKEYKGDISVDSNPGKGSAFKIYLPLIESQTFAESPEKEVPPSAGNERILLVDDEEAIIRLERQMLERLGYRVTSRTDSMDALAVFRASPMAFDLVVTDMTMPFMTGEQLAREMISVRPDIPVIICTGFSERINEKKIKDAGIKSFLMKPVGMSDLADCIRNVLDHKNS